MNHQQNNILYRASFHPTPTDIVENRVKQCYDAITYFMFMKWRRTNHSQMFSLSKKHLLKRKNKIIIHTKSKFWKRKPVIHLTVRVLIQPTPFFWAYNMLALQATVQSLCKAHQSHHRLITFYIQMTGL